MKWVKDEDFIRANVAMTKFNIRALNMAYLNISLGDLFLDIGAGTGSVSIEASLQGAHVWAIDKDKESIELLIKNRKKFAVNMEVIEGIAPCDLPHIVFDKCFIGGSTGKMGVIFQYLKTYLKTGGILCANFIKLENLNDFMTYLKEYNFQETEISLIQSSTMDEKGLLKGSNPIFIGKGVKK